MSDPITFLAVTPERDASGVSATTPLFVAYRVDGGYTLTGVTVHVNDVLADSNDIFQEPDFSGISSNSGGDHTLFITPRRAFEPGSMVKVHYEFTLNPPLVVALDYLFFIAEPTATLLDPSLQITRIDQPFPEHLFALEALRRRLIAVLHPRPGASVAVQLFHRVYFSQLRAMTPIFNLPASIEGETRRLLKEDIAGLESADAVLTALEPVSSQVLRELLSLGAQPADIQLIFDALRCDFPQERVAAACAALLLAAARAV